MTDLSGALRQLIHFFHIDYLSDIWIYVWMI